ncbi:hypothetical protein [Streptomyces sp. NPDC000229]|uniref:hypothetical protein n=1 Tax=Streptomyces sp. NPDC000229 TaxID=3154247 RepID=UPI004037FA9E
MIVATLTEEGHTGLVHEVTGPAPLTFAEVAAEISRAAGREVRHVPVTAEEYAGMLREYGLPAPAGGRSSPATPRAASNRPYAAASGRTVRDGSPYYGHDAGRAVRVRSCGRAPRRPPLGGNGPSRRTEGRRGCRTG